MVSKARTQGATPLFDLGDDLTFRLPIPEADRARQELRADLILREMAGMGYDGLVPGERDLAFGLDRLRKASKDLKLPLLSANLVPVTGDNPFVGHVEVKAGELDICAVGVNGVGDYGPEVTRTDPSAAALRELATFTRSPCDLRIVLAHMDRAELDKLLKEAPGFDAAIVGHQGQQFQPQRSGEITIFGDGAKGRAVGEIHLGIADGSTSGPLYDRGEADRLHDSEKQLQKQIDDLKKRIDTTPEAARANSQRSLEMLQSRLKDTRSKLPEAEHKRDPRVYSFEWVNLGTDVADVPALKAEVDAFDKDHPEPVAPPPPRPPAMMRLADGGVVPAPPPPFGPRPVAGDGGQAAPLADGGSPAHPQRVLPATPQH